MKYIVIELQTNSDGTVGNLVYAYDTQPEAESKYHAVLSAAAVSTIPVHAAVLMDNTGFFLERKSYKHEVAQEQE